MVHAKAKLTPAGKLLIVIRFTEEGWAPAHATAMAVFPVRLSTSGSAATANKGRWA